MRRDTMKSVKMNEKAPGSGDKKDSIPIPDDDSLANLIAAIAGGIEAPIQFILQVWIGYSNCPIRSRIDYFYDMNIKIKTTSKQNSML